MGVRIKIVAVCDLCGKKVEGTARLFGGFMGMGPELMEHDLETSAPWKSWVDETRPAGKREVLACPECSSEHGPKG